MIKIIKSYDTIYQDKKMLNIYIKIIIDSLYNFGHYDLIYDNPVTTYYALYPLPSYFITEGYDDIINENNIYILKGKPKTQLLFGNTNIPYSPINPIPFTFPVIIKDNLPLCFGLSDIESELTHICKDVPLFSETKENILNKIEDCIMTSNIDLAPPTDTLHRSGASTPLRSIDPTELDNYQLIAKYLMKKRKIELLNSNVYYFEIEILAQHRLSWENESLIIGYSNLLPNITSLPGINKNSFGYNVLMGIFYYDNIQKCNLPRGTVGDIYGCGIRYVNNTEIEPFVTLNGDIIFKHEIIKFDSVVSPIFLLNCSNKVKVNFFEFKFNIKNYLNNYYVICRTINSESKPELYLKIFPIGSEIEPNFKIQA